MVVGSKWWLVALLNVYAFKRSSLCLHVKLMVNIIINPKALIDVSSSFTTVTRELISNVFVEYPQMTHRFRILCTQVIVRYHLSRVC